MKVLARTEENSASLDLLTQRCEYLENQSRRNNLLLYNIPDVPGESWKQSEEKAINFCETRLGVCLSPQAIERAHRIGPYRGNEANPRPVIIKFNSYKDRELILSKAPALKGTIFRLSEDLSPDTRAARKALISFAKNQGSEFKLRHDKLFIGRSQYRFDKLSNTVLLTQT